MSFTRPFLLDPVFFRTALPCSGGYDLKSGGMPLLDVVGINYKKGATTENQGVCCAVYVDDCVCVLSNDMTTPPWWREKVVVYYYYLKITRNINTLAQIRPRVGYSKLHVVWE